MFPYHALICSSHIESDTANLNSWNKVFFKFNDSRSKKVLCNNMSLIDINFDVEDSLLMKHGPNTIRFDAMGALFVVGGSNGKLLVYDFDESLALTTLNKKCNQIEKRCIKPVISYDVRKEISDIRWSLANNDLVYVSYSFDITIDAFDLNSDDLEPIESYYTGTDVTDGHNVLLILYSSMKNCEFILAGSSCGKIRKWDDQCSSRTNWDIPGDPYKKKGLPIVSLLGLAGGKISGGFLALDKEGILTIWDYDNTCTAVFGSNAIPSLIHRVDLPSVIYKAVHYHPGGILGASNLTSDSHTIILTCYSCELFLFDTLLLKVIDKRQNSGIVRKEVGKAITCRCPVVSLSNNSFIHLITGTLREDVESDINIFNFFTIVEPLQVLPPLVTKRKQRCYHYRLSLPGKVIKLQDGQSEVLCSTDLSEYLISERLASHDSSRSHEILLCFDDSDSLNSIANDTNAFVISSVDGNTIFLRDTYRGISIENGFPHVRLKTNLEFVSEYCSSSSKGASDSLNMNLDNLRSSSAPVTATTAHPELPYFILGFKNNEIKILGPDTMS